MRYDTLVISNFCGLHAQPKLLLQCLYQNHSFSRKNSLSTRPLYNNSNNTITLTYVTALHISPLKLTKLTFIVHSCYGFLGSQIMIAPEKLTQKENCLQNRYPKFYDKYVIFSDRLVPPCPPLEFPPLLITTSKGHIYTPGWGNFVSTPYPRTTGLHLGVLFQADHQLFSLGRNPQYKHTRPEYLKHTHNLLSGLPLANF